MTANIKYILDNLQTRLSLAEDLKHDPGRQFELNWQLHDVVTELQAWKKRGIGRLLIHRPTRTETEAELAKIYSNLLRRLAVSFPKESAELDQYNPACFERRFMAHLAKYPFSYHQIKQELVDLAACHWLATNGEAEFFLDNDGMSKIKRRATELAAKGEKGKTSNLIKAMTEKLTKKASTLISNEVYGDPLAWTKAEKLRVVFDEVNRRLEAKDPQIIVDWQKFEALLGCELYALLSDFSFLQHANVMAMRLKMFSEIGVFNDPAMIQEHEDRSVVLQNKIFGECQDLFLAADASEGKSPEERRPIKLELFHATVDAFRQCYGMRAHRTEYYLECREGLAGYIRIINPGSIINTYQITNIENIDALTIACIAAHEATHELQDERKHQGKNYVLPQIETIASTLMPCSPYTLTRTPIKPLEIRKSNGEIVEANSNDEIARAISMSPRMQMELYALCAYEREAYAVQFLLKAHMLRSRRMTLPADADPIPLQQDENSARSIVDRSWAFDREPQRVIGPPTHFLQDVERLCL